MSINFQKWALGTISALALSISHAELVSEPPSAAINLTASVTTSTEPLLSVRENQTGISLIDFARNAQGDGQVLIDLWNEKTALDIRQQGSKVIVESMAAPLPEQLLRRLNVNDFATAVSSINAYNRNGHGIVEVETTGSFEYMAYQSQKRLTLSFKRPTASIASQRQPEHYTGKKISLDFQDIEVRRVLQLLAEFTQINMISSDSVQGNMTLRLRDVPWDQALDIILKSKGLDQRRNGNVIWIAPIAELGKADEEEAKAMAQRVKLAPLQTEYIQLSYARANAIRDLIVQGANNQNGRQYAGQSTQSDGVSNHSAVSSNLNTGVDDQGNNIGSLLSPRGTVTVDERTNTLIVNDIAEKIDQIRKMINLLDVRVKQVMVEARIVRASTSFTQEMGVKWGILSNGINQNNDLLVGGSETTLWNLRRPDSSGQYNIERPSNLNVDLGVSSPGASRIAFGLISLSDFMLDLELSALQADGYGEVISTPKVMTADKQTAKVSTGQEVPYQSTTNIGGGSTATTSFKEALLSLEVTPSITPDGKIQMLLDISKDSIAGAAPNGELILNKNTINTNVLVDNGETVILGGVFEQTTRNNQTKVPFLGDLPWVGRLFRRDLKADDKQELLIFVTPRIVNDTQVRNQ